MLFNWQGGGGVGIYHHWNTVPPQSVKNRDKFIRREVHIDSEVNEVRREMSRANRDMRRKGYAVVKVNEDTGLPAGFKPLAEERIAALFKERSIIVPVPLPLPDWDVLCTFGCGGTFKAPADPGVLSIPCPYCGRERDLRSCNSTECLFGYWKGLNGMGYY